MIPYIHICGIAIPTFPLCVITGILVMLLLVLTMLKRYPEHVAEENFILPKIVISGGIGYVFAAVFDSLAKIRMYHEFRFAGISFYGGLIGATISLFVLLKVAKAPTQLTTKAWFDLLTIPFIIFHIFGRTGCFLGGCCYGKPTDGLLGVCFPDNAAQGLFHDGVACYPTQLFEVFALLLIIVLLIKSNDRFADYIILYAIARFFIEYFRGDVRGSISALFSPAQVISMILFIIGMSYKLYKTLTANRHHTRS